MIKNIIKTIIRFSFVYMFIIPVSVYAQSGLQEIIHSVEAEPVEGKVAYTVKVFLSVLDNSNTPIKDLKIGDFSLAEESQKKEIISVEPIDNESISLVLVMDTSGSMSAAIYDAREAASTFLERLGANDQSAVIAFNDEIQTVASFTNNHQSSSEAVKQITAVNLAGTCLYDAAYQAIEMGTTTPPGRRGVIIFTDGKDETRSGQTCSIHTVDDVLAFAKNNGTPVYTIGMGLNIDEKELKRIATTTGGSYLKSENSAELDSIFSKLYDQLNNEYVLTYTSTNYPGPHDITINANYRNLKDQETYTFNLPDLPTMIAFNYPKEGGTVSGKVTLNLKVLTQGDEIASIEFASNGVIIGKDISEPYELEWDTNTTYPGETVLEAVAMGKDGAELARTALNLTIQEQTPVPEIPPATISFSFPSGYEALSGKVTLKAEAVTVEEEIGSVEFASGGIVIGKDISEPYEFNWDTTLVSSGITTLEAIAIGKNGVELARTELSVTILEPTPVLENTPTATIEPTVTPTVIPPTTFEKLLKDKNFPVYIGVAAALLIALIVILIISGRRKKTDQPEGNGEFKLIKPDLGEDATIDGIRYPSNLASIATLTVQFSDDPASIGHQYQITTLPVILGRSAEADILFSGKDQAISRRHAKIDQNDNQIIISDMKSKYGTFINEKLISDSPISLKNGDIIRLGSRTKLIFEKVSYSDDAKPTIDGIDISGLANEATRESF